jgi:yecA family protein
VTDVFAYAELDEILRGAGRTGAIGMSAIDGLIAALVAAPSFVHPEEWIPLIFGGRQPLHENSPELHAVNDLQSLQPGLGNAGRLAAGLSSDLHGR